MCVGGGSPEPDINKPAYDPGDIDKNIKLTMIKDGKTTDIERQDAAAYGDGPVAVKSSGIAMRGGKGGL
jgi:hypothetical protein